MGLNSTLHYNNSIGFGINTVTVPIPLMKLHYQDKNQVSVTNVVLFFPFSPTNCWLLHSTMLNFPAYPTEGGLKLSTACSLPVPSHVSRFTQQLMGVRQCSCTKVWKLHLFLSNTFFFSNEFCKAGNISSRSLCTLQHKAHFNTQLPSHWDCVIYTGLKDIKDIFLFPLSWH